MRYVQRFVPPFVFLFVLATVLALSGRPAIADSSSSASPVPAATSADPGDSAVAARAQSWFGMLQTGKVDRTQLTQDMNDALPDDKLAQLAAQLKPLGKVSSFRLLSKGPSGAYMVYTYRVGLSGNDLVFNFTLDATGKIAGLWVKPADQ